MNDKFLGRYRINSIRLSNWDYSSPGYYFVTICIKNREPYFFGNIENSQVILNNIGKIVKQNWLNIEKHFNNVKLHEFIVMPNHVHGIIQIKKMQARCGGNAGQRDASTVETRGASTVETRYIASLQHGQGSTQMDCDIASLQKANKFGPLPSKSLSSIIHAYKSACTRQLKKQGHIFVSFWQPRFYEHVIRSQQTLLIIGRYIENNARQWQWDKNNPQNFNAY